MGYKKIGYMLQIWYAVKYAVRSWLEWQDAKHWAKDCHPAWVVIATKARRENVRKMYKQKILRAYRGEEDGK